MTARGAFFLLGWILRACGNEGAGTSRHPWCPSAFAAGLAARLSAVMSKDSPAS